MEASKLSFNIQGKIMLRLLTSCPVFCFREYGVPATSTDSRSFVCGGTLTELVDASHPVCGDSSLTYCVCLVMLIRILLCTESSFSNLLVVI